MHTEFLESKRRSGFASFCSFETVSTIREQFRDNGLIQMDGRTITIMNEKELSKLLD